MKKFKTLFFNLVFLFVLLHTTAAAQHSPQWEDSLDLLDPFINGARILQTLREDYSRLTEENQKLSDSCLAVIINKNGKSSPDDITSAYITRGDIYFQTALYSDAINTFYQILNDCEQRGDSLNAAIIKLKIVQVFYFADLVLPQNYFAEALPVLQSSKKKEHIARALSLESKFEKDEIKQRELLNKAVAVQREVVQNNPQSLSAKAQYARLLGAVNDMPNAIRMAEESGDKWLLVLLLNNYGHSKFEEGEYSQSLTIYFRSLALCKEHHFKTLLRNTTGNISKSYRLQGNYVKAIWFQQLAVLVSEVLYTDRFSYLLSEQKIKFETTKKELENNFLKKEKEILAAASESQQNVIYLLIISFFGVSFTLYIVHSNSRKIKAANTLLDTQNREILDGKKQVEQINMELLKSEKNLKDAQETANISDWELDTEKREMKCSEQFIKQFKLNKGMNQIKIEDFINHNIDERYKDLLSDFLTIDSGWGNEIDFKIHLDEKTRWIKAKKRYVLDSQESIGKIFGTFQDITSEKEHEEIRIKMAGERSFTKQLIQSQEEERKRIAGELHDGLGQDLLLIKNRAVFGLKNDNKDEFSEQQFREIDKSVSAILNSVRELSFNLTPAHLERIGLVATINSMIKKAAASSIIEFDYEIDAINNLLAKGEELSLFRIVQEVLSNIMKHAAASKVFLEIKQEENKIKLTIADNGKGFDTERVKTSSEGFGMKNLFSRVQLLGGTIIINSEENRGTTFNIDIPVQQHE